MWWVLISYALFSAASVAVAAAWSGRSRRARGLAVAGLLLVAWVLVCPLTPNIIVTPLQSGPGATLNEYRSTSQTYSAGPYRVWLGANSIFRGPGGDPGDSTYRLLVHAAPPLSFADSTAVATDMCGSGSEPCPTWFLNRFGAQFVHFQPDGASGHGASWISTVPRAGYDQPLAFIRDQTPDGGFVIATQPLDLHPQPSADPVHAWAVRVALGLSWWRSAVLVLILTATVGRAARADRLRGQNNPPATV